MRHLLKSAAAKGFLLTALLLFAASICRAQSVAPETPDYILRSGGMERTYKLHLPAGLPENAPLVVVLHGYGGNNNPDRFAMNATADRHGFAVCYPQGAKDGRGKSCWNVGYPFQADMTVDDVRFLTELVRHLQKKHGLSRHNIFCTGMSNGGEMCYQLAAQRPRLFAAVAPVSGLMLDWLYKAEYRAGSALRNPRHGGQDLGMAGRSAKQRRLGSLSARAAGRTLLGGEEPLHRHADRHAAGKGTRRPHGDRAPLHGRHRGQRGVALRNRRRQTLVGRAGHRHGRGAVEILQQVRKVGGTAPAGPKEECSERGRQ